MITVADDFTSLSLVWCTPSGSPAVFGDQAIKMHFPLLSAITDCTRDDDIVPPNASIDRAFSKAAAEMLSWSKDPESFELHEHRRNHLFLRWPGRKAEAVNEYAYGLWDE